MAKPLPTPRQFLTSLINSLPPPPPPSTATSGASNASAALPRSAHPVFTTLHTLIPPPTLLQALDLLDRGFVTRVTQAPPRTATTGPGSSSSDVTEVERHEAPKVVPPQAPQHLAGGVGAEGAGNSAHQGDDDDAEQASREEERDVNSFYVVRSAQEARSRGSRYGSGMGTGGGAGSSRSYIVRLKAWNCSCAAFTFSAFPASGSRNLFNRDYGEENNVDEEGHEGGNQRGAGRKWGYGDSGEGDEGWEFGGLSRDGRDGDGGVPCCKHLLACLLVERWSDILGSYAKEVEVGREEMAGLGAEG